MNAHCLLMLCNRTYECHSLQTALEALLHKIKCFKCEWVRTMEEIKFFTSFYMEDGSCFQCIETREGIDVQTHLP